MPENHWKLRCVEASLVSGRGLANRTSQKTCQCQREEKCLRDDGHYNQAERYTYVCTCITALTVPAGGVCA